MSLLLALVCLTQLTSATHFAFGTMSWVRNVEPHSFTLTAQGAFRTSYYDRYGGVRINEPLDVYCDIIFMPEDCSCPSCSYINGGDNGYQPADCRWSGVSSSNAVHWLDDDGSEYTGSTKATTFKQNVMVNPLIIYDNDDYFAGEFSTNVTIPDLEIDGWSYRDNRWHLFFYGYARVSGLEESNNDVGWKMDIILDPNFESTPFSTGFPRETAAVGVDWVFTIPSTSPQLLDMTYAIAPYWYDVSNTWEGQNSHLRTNIPGSTMGNPIELDANDFTNTGVMTWTPDQVGLYAIQVHIIDSNGMICPLDFIIDVIELCS